MGTMLTGKPPIATMHLYRYRGAPAVHSWSKYQATVKEWSLCGIRQSKAEQPPRATEDADRVNCPYCRRLMQPVARRGGQAAA